MKTGFYPYPLRGGRRLSTKVFLLSGYISIHALREEGDDGKLCLTLPRGISIHALREEGDFRSRRTPGREWAISIHALREEGDIGGVIG